MVICLVGQERNLGILTLTDYLIEKLGKPKICVVGWNYLMQDTQKLMDKISLEKEKKIVLVKYIIPKIRFSNQGFSFPSDLKDACDVIFRVPSYREEISPTVPLMFIKEGDVSIMESIRKFYA